MLPGLATSRRPRRRSMRRRSGLRQLRPEVLGSVLPSDAAEAGLKPPRDTLLPAKDDGSSNAETAVAGLGVQDFILSGNPGCNDDMLLSLPRYLVCRPGSSLAGLRFQPFVRSG